MHAELLKGKVIDFPKKQEHNFHRFFSKEMYKNWTLVGKRISFLLQSFGHKMTVTIQLYDI